MTAVSLSVHKNTVERRRKRALAKELVAKVGALVVEQDIRAYAIVGIAADGSPYAFWDTGAVLPMWCFPEVVSSALKKSIISAVEEGGLQDDWRPALGSSKP